ncbi:MAG: M14 family zinc carboxypeptidase [Planctomycetota bacterium]|nr:M14 family zinc carboxypeptidase [Planctomycetota bacterium]
MKPKTRITPNSSPTGIAQPEHTKIYQRAIKVTCLLLVFASVTPSLHGEPRPGSAIRINASFPGGNVVVDKIEDRTVHIAPDLRGGRQWFYWNFEAEVTQPGRVNFVFPENAGAQIGVNGPAISLDAGRTWKWLGDDHARFRSVGRDSPAVPSDSFWYDFTAEHRKVRFSVGIPYLQSNLDEFIKRIGDNPHLFRDMLTKSRKGRPVALWHIGQPGPDAIPVLVSARHHACEALASYVLEGFLEEALSDSLAGVAFRKKYMLYAVPIVDVDGVAEGDQGKWRSPHDHNRDYGQERMIYPPVISMVELAKAKKIKLALDFHCPTLRMDIHQGFYFAGIRLPHIKNNMDELIGWMDEERPPAVTWSERDLMAKPGPSAPTGGMPFSNFFAYQDGVDFAATLESPFTQHGNGLDDNLARAYGKGLLRAWVRMEFISSKPTSVRLEWDTARLVAFRKSFTSVYQSKPTAAEAIADPYLSNAQSPALYRIEASNLMGMLRFRQRNYAEAFAYFEAALTDVHSTARQRALAASERARITCADSMRSLADLAKALDAFAAIPHPSPKQQAAVHAAAAAAYEIRDVFDKALIHARFWFNYAGRYDRGEALNAVANLLDKAGQPEQAIETRKQAVQILRKELDPVPVGVFGPLMAADLLDALNGIPTATVAEKKAAANIALNHKVKPPSVLRRIQVGLEGIK